MLWTPAFSRGAVLLVLGFGVWGRGTALHGWVLMYRGLVFVVLSRLELRHFQTLSTSYRLAISPRHGIISQPNNSITPSPVNDHAKRARRSPSSHPSRPRLHCTILFSLGSLGSLGFRIRRIRLFRHHIFELRPECFDRAEFITNLYDRVNQHVEV